MKFFCILLALAPFCHIISTQGDEDQYSGLGFLKPYVEQRVRNCGQIWILGCGPASTPSSRPKGLCRCDTNLALASDSIELHSLDLHTGHLGGKITIFCAFSGYPLSTVSWTGPQRSLPAGRHTKSNWDTTLIITNLTAADEGNYTCRGSNMFGQDNRTLQISVVAAPEFKTSRDVPYNATVTEGESVTFRCNPYGRPAAKIVWLQNGQPLDADNPPERYEFSSDHKNLTIRDVCRNCVGRRHKTDQMVIQCNASNVHGQAFAEGYLKVLIKTNVTIKGPENVSVDFLVEKQFVFQCAATSDPTSPSTVRWYKTKPSNELVRNEPPYVNVTNEFLIITTYPSCSAECVKYLGEYRCVGDNGYSRDNQTITLAYVFRPPPNEQNTRDPQSVSDQVNAATQQRLVVCGNRWVAGCLTKVEAEPTGLCQCAPNLEAYSAIDRTVGPGESVTFFCIIHGFPLPSVSWKGPQDSLPAERHLVAYFGQVLTLTGITASDEGNYSCTASNSYGQITQTLRIRVIAAPEFKNTTDAPYNVTVTDGESVTFNCNAIARPEAEIVWHLNQQPIDAASPPERFVFSNDNRSLTIRDVCRDCVDRERKTDQMAIQCNASNVHGYAVAQGYLNVLQGYPSVFTANATSLSTNATTNANSTEVEGQMEEVWAAWKIIFAAVAIGIGLLLVGIFAALTIEAKHRRRDPRYGGEIDP